MTNPNDRRARRFGKTLRSYHTDNTDKGRQIDLLTDARHWCDRHEQDYARPDRIAYEHYAVEASDHPRRPS